MRPQPALLGPGRELRSLVTLSWQAQEGSWPEQSACSPPLLASKYNIHVKKPLLHASIRRVLRMTCMRSAT